MHPESEPEPEPRTRQELAGPYVFQLLDSYQAEGAEGRRQIYTRADDDGRIYRFVSFWEDNVFAKGTKADYANALAKRIDELFLHTGKVEGRDALTALGTAGATVRPGRGADRAFCIVEFIVPQMGGDSFVMQQRLYFVGTTAVRLGLGCRCPQEMEQETKFLVDEEMSKLAETIDLA